MGPQTGAQVRANTNPLVRKCCEIHGGRIPEACYLSHHGWKSWVGSGYRHQKMPVPGSCSLGLLLLAQRSAATAGAFLDDLVGRRTNGTKVWAFPCREFTFQASQWNLNCGITLSSECYSQGQILQRTGRSCAGFVRAYSRAH